MSPTLSRETLYAWPLLVAYVLLLIYGTLFPLSNWHTPVVNLLQLMLQHDLHNSSRADILTNILVYLPLGLLLMWAMIKIRCDICRVLIAVLCCTVLSLALEYIQAHLPGRVPSVSDLILNTFGGFIGALFALFVHTDSFIGKHLSRIRTIYFHPGPITDLGLVIAALWALSQLSPLVPSIDLGNLRHGLKPLVNTLLSPSTLEWIRVGEYAFAIAALGILSGNLQRIKYNSLFRFTLVVLLILLLKIPIVSRQISLEACLGLGIGLLLILVLESRSFRIRLGSAAILLIGTVLCSSLYTPPHPSSITNIPPFSMNWVPFKGHLTNNITGIIDILGGLWPFMFFIYIAIVAGCGRRIWIAAVGAVLIFCLMFTLEWKQQFILGRSADITDVILPVIAWLSPWFYPAFWISEDSTNDVTTASSKQFRKINIYIISSAIAIIATLAIALWNHNNIDTLKLEHSQHQPLPPPEAVTTTNMPGFNYLHPRLPAPSTNEILLLQRHNPDFFKRHRIMADAGKGKLYSVILMSYVEPGSQDLKLLHQRLMKLNMSWRGHQQAKPLALAYDWLYTQWTNSQRKQLLTKVIDASNYLIQRIRVTEELSPYNVYLYNSPLQALMATSLASYGDSPEAELPMRWSADYWKNRVLPIWRQIMGENGGWHEGGEYVGIGIGGAVYQLPAMWRKATNEDLFRTESGLRGFLDFLVYRTRPDGTHMRWGDSLFFDRMIPDRSALALEYGHKASYSLGKCPSPFQPSAWPWGQLTTDALCSDRAYRDLPLQQYFDGIGLVVARSSWDRDATYLTFKAGDNYWSHSHLDQGAFTLFKGVPLAIDSGLYGPGYGSDHHMNYTYQTIAHNVITVTDPNDNLPAPAKKKNPPRHIANDGGQRRIGSGWGVEKAPLDLDEWLRKREIYHTGKIHLYHSQDDLVVAVADITPAYRNKLSGQGTFSHRTRRVEKYWRTIIYDRRSDVVVVYDNLISSNPEFKKRSLIHSINQPHRTSTGFITSYTVQNHDRKINGQMEATLLYPENAEINIIGGRNKEFLVNNVNYDEDGKVWSMVNRPNNHRPEPGSWRVEISPPLAQTRDRFLMVLRPTTDSADPSPLIQRLSKNVGFGASIRIPNRALKFIFPEDREGVLVKLNDGNSVKDIDLTVIPSATATNKTNDQSIWQRIKGLFD